MNIQEAKQEIKNALRIYFRRDESGRYIFPAVCQRPLLLMGPPGIGKTAVVAQAAAEAGVGLVSYTMTHHTRQSAIGLPHIETRDYQGTPVSVTCYTLSEIVASVYDCMERSGKREGILFLDEINCVSETLAPTMLQFLQNKTFGNHKIPEGWLIVAAGNPPGYNRSVREFDVVTLDRVRQIDVEPDLAAWMDYARQKRLHGAILAYLGVHEDHFYRVERTADGVSFVTARGWEDLSELMRGGEHLDIPVAAAQIAQYLRSEEIAREFAGYCRLYRKYGAAYSIPEILGGAADAAPCIAMAQKAAFDERLAVVNQVLDYLDGRFIQYERTDRDTAALHRALEALQLFMRDRADMECLGDFIRGRRDALQIKREAGLLSPEEEDGERWVLAQLAEYEIALKAAHIRSKAEGFDRIKALFQEAVLRREALVEELNGLLERGFAFLAGCFGGGQEMILFVSALTRLDRAMDFICRHGCEPYLRCSRKLLYQEREQTLRRACAEALGEPLF